MLSLTSKSWSPYVAGIVIGLLQIPAFLLIETALGASSSYVTVGGLIASWVDPSILRIDYVAKHVALTGKNWWQVALVAGIAIGAFVSMKLSGARRQTISPIWARALGSASPARRYAVAFAAGFIMLFGAGSPMAAPAATAFRAQPNSPLARWLQSRRCLPAALQPRLHYSAAPEEGASACRSSPQS